MANRKEGFRNREERFEIISPNKKYDQLSGRAVFMAKDLMNNKIQSKLDIKMTEKYCPKEMAAARRA